MVSGRKSADNGCGYTVPNFKLRRVSNNIEGTIKGRPGKRRTT
jgi:hypothetical protein